MQLERAYIFDIVTKVYITADSSPADYDAFELCSDMIDLSEDIGAIYQRSSAAGNRSPAHSPTRRRHDERANAEVLLDNGQRLVLHVLGSDLTLVGVTDARSEARIHADDIRQLYERLSDILNL